MTAVERTKSSSQFARYLGPVIEAIRELGGSGRPNEVRTVIARELNISEAEQSEPLPSGGKAEISTALDRFDEAHPEFRNVRDFQEHILNPALIGTSMYFAGGALVRLCSDGRTETLIDPALLAEDAEALHRSVCDVLGPLPPVRNDWAIGPADKRRR